MLLPWFGVEASLTLPGSPEPVVVVEGGRNAWESFAVIDIVLAVAAVLAISLVTRAAVSIPPPALPLAVAVAAALAAVLVVYRLIDIPEIPVEVSSETAYATTRRLGAFFGLLCTAGIAWGANLAMLGAAEVEPQLAEREPAPEGAPDEPEPAPEPEPKPAPEAEPAPEPAALDHDDRLGRPGQSQARLHPKPREQHREQQQEAARTGQELAGAGASRSHRAETLTARAILRIRS